MIRTEPSRYEPICGMETWHPVPAEILSVRQENLNTRTFTIRIVDETIRRSYQWAPGQFNMLYAPGIGEAAISISSDVNDSTTLDHTIRVVGSVTQAIDRMGTGGIVGIRGPFGRGWPMEKLFGRDIVLVAGGIGLAPLRPVIYGLLQHRERYDRVILLFGCRSPDDKLFSEELDAWMERDDIDCMVTVDHATAGWTGPVGVVTNLLQRIRVDADKTTVLVCGPRILNRVAAWNFLQLHVPQDQVYVSLERNMNCGFGRCGHCQYGSKFVCKDGPVFGFDEISDIFAKEEI